LSISNAIFLSLKFSSSKSFGAVIEVKGNKKGALSEAIEEAIKLWLEKYG